MCGLAGIIGNNLSLTEINAFSNALMLNVWRGRDSTGVIRVSDKGTKIFRTMKPSPHFIHSDEAKFLRPEKEEKMYALMGHTRHATMGAVNIKNAHPFRSGHIVGAHNGTIEKKFKGRSDYDTDSEAVFALIAQEGIEAALNEIAAYTSAYVLQWVDLKEGTINLIKNSRRPLNMTYIYGQSGLVWSSEEKTLLLALEKAGIKNTQSYDKKPGTFTLEDNHLFSVKIGVSPAFDLDTTDVEAIKVKTPLYYPPKKQIGYHTGGNYGGAGTGYDHGYSDAYGRDMWDDYDGSATDYSDVWPDSPKAVGVPEDNANYTGYSNWFSPEEMVAFDWLPGDEEPVGFKEEGWMDGEIYTTWGVSERYGDIPKSALKMEACLEEGCLTCGKELSLKAPALKKQISNIRWVSDKDWQCNNCRSKETVSKFGVKG